MRRPARTLQLPRRLGLRRFLEELSRLGTVTTHKGTPVDRTFSDTFDWRLYRGGHTLVQETEGEESRLVLSSLPGEKTRRKLKGSLPDFARSLRESSFRNTLAGMTEPRLLLRLARVRTERETYTLSDVEGAVVARLAVETHRAFQDGSLSGSLLQRRVRVEFVEGDAAQTGSLLAFFRVNLKLRPPRRSLFEEAMDAVGKSPGDYTSRVSLTLEPAAPAEASLRRILLTLADFMETNAPGTREGRDPEFLHDFRVAVRRTRSALGRLKGVLPPAETAAFGKELAWLQDATGPARDMDVYLLGLPGYRSSLPPREAEGLEPLKLFFEGRAKDAREAVCAAIGSQRFRDFMASWKEFLNRGVSPGADTPFAAVPTEDLAGTRIWKVYRRAVREGRRITEDSPVADLHELRKTCKKLRYLMEFFRGLYPAKKVEKLISDLKKLQDNLGDFNDLQVQSDYLESVAEELMRENMPPETYLALGRLVEALRWRSVREREMFLSCFRRFDREKNRRLFRKLFWGRRVRGHVPAVPDEGGFNGQGD